MARRTVQDGRISPIFAVRGPLRSVALQHAGGDAELADRWIAEWRAWRDKYGLDFDRGRGAPPPHHDTLGRGFARPVA
jgi:hypothetical protein